MTRHGRRVRHNRAYANGDTPRARSQPQHKGLIASNRLGFAVVACSEGAGIRSNGHKPDGCCAKVLSNGQTLK